VVVDIDWSGISTGTEKLLWSGRMPPFPGMGYPLVPGYESVGRVVQAGPASGTAGRAVFVPGRRCFGGARACSAAPRAPGGAGRARLPVDEQLGERACCWRWPPRPTTRCRARARTRCSRPTSSSATACWAACWRA
jgi:3-hydroxyethyl bacteriochlorophyllide a dehydrogenase